MGLLLGSIPLGQRGPPGGGGLCVSSTSSSLARCKGNVPMSGEHAKCRTESSDAGACCTHPQTSPTADFTSVSVGDLQLLPGTICGHRWAQPHPLDGRLLHSQMWNKDSWPPPDTSFFS